MVGDPLRGARYRVMSLVPNGLTVLRLAIAGWFPFAPESTRIALVLIAASSDFLDGWVARRYHLTSWVGALLDGIADKAITLSVLLTFTIEGTLAWWQLLLVMSRDVAVVAIAAYLAWCRAWGEFTRIAARQPGKVTTLFVYALMAVLLIAPDFAPWLLWPACLMSLLAAFDYVVVSMSVAPERGGRASQ